MPFGGVGSVGDLEAAGITAALNRGETFVSEMDHKPLISLLDGPVGTGNLDVKGIHPAGREAEQEGQQGNGTEYASHAHGFEKQK